ncbi:hypothetical protein M2132_000536 [Dysgonomonas sp. PH5-45]|uniref:hypothetical protein n=1 Tax=unclassified Dysgonomonas TaxID=2630389 RepID=UPI00247391EF|nr:MULTISPECIES: hypothetical protein [unclassified Dysgonomonas]MDH6354209.1 hypothetical protein [Dysgonomonas sp. PH5-45]MDH6387110.1 hypothetical protein [Dysgonomonas sp. PH5-37]
MYRLQHILTLLFLLLATSFPCKAQSENRIENWKQQQLAAMPSTKMKVEEWKEFDFSILWLNPHPYQGYLGEGWYSDLEFAFNKVERISSTEYLVEGVISRNHRERDFKGSLLVDEVRELKELDFGIDDWMEGKIKKQGLVIANFHLDTDKEQEGDGAFRGIVVSRWYVDLTGQLLYDDIPDDSDAYINNQFVGTWAAYDRDHQPIKCAWGQYKIPDIDDSATEIEEISVEEVGHSEEVEVISLSVYETMEEAEAAMAAMIAGQDVPQYDKPRTNEKNTETKAPANSKKISILNGSAVLEMEKSVDEFPCIVLRLADKNIKMSTGTYLEIKRQDGFYLIKVKYDPKRYRTIDKGIEDYLKELFARFYEDKDKKYGKKVWAAFVKEGGLQLFIETAKEYIDDEFLDSPFNEIYG